MKQINISQTIKGKDFISLIEVVGDRINLKIQRYVDGVVILDCNYLSLGSVDELNEMISEAYYIAQKVQNELGN